jgi:hypothetical protein
MKSLNENWFAFTLIAVIFGLLGFLLGRTTGHHGPHGPMDMHPMIMSEGHIMDKAMFITDDGEVHDLMGDLDIDMIDKIDVVKGENGEITVTIDSLETSGDAKAKVRVITKKISSEK